MLDQNINTNITTEKTRFDKVRENFFSERTPLYTPFILCRQVFSGGNIPTCAEYNSNNTWNFNGNNRCLNNNNRYNSVFRCRPVLDFVQKNEKDNNNYLIPLVELFELEKQYYNGKPNAVKFRTNYFHNIILLWHKLNRQELTIGTTYRVVIDIPKIREIIYCDYVDKLIQSFFVKQINPILETKWFHKDSYSCRKGKGVLKAVDTFQQYLIETVENNETPENIYVASVDLKNFFMSIDVKLAIQLMSEFIERELHNHPRKELLLYLCNFLYNSNYCSNYIDLANKNIDKKLKREKTLIYNQPERGVPIGNWPSQILGIFLTTFALNYLTKLGYKFVHYTDDTAIIVTDKEKYLSDIKLLEQFYQDKLHLKLHPNKRYLQHYSKGITFLGRKIKVNRKLPSNRTFYSLIGLLRRYLILLKSDKYNVKFATDFHNSFNSYFGLLRTTDSFRIRKTIINIIDKFQFFQYFKSNKNIYSKINLKNIFKQNNLYKKYFKILKINNVINKIKINLDNLNNL